MKWKFITKKLFHKIDDFENTELFEIVEVIKKGILFSKFGIIPAYILTSARRYKCKGVFYLQYHFALLHYKYKKGLKTEQLKNIT